MFHAFAFPNHFNKWSAGSNNGMDVLIHASAICAAQPLQEQEGLSTYAQDMLTVLASLAGVPALSVPDNGGDSVSLFSEFIVFQLSLPLPLSLHPQCINA